MYGCIGRALSSGVRKGGANGTYSRVVGIMICEDSYFQAVGHLFYKSYLLEDRRHFFAELVEFGKADDSFSHVSVASPDSFVRASSGCFIS